MEFKFEQDFDTLEEYQAWFDTLPLSERPAYWKALALHVGFSEAEFNDFPENIKV